MTKIMIYLKRFVRLFKHKHLAGHPASRILRRVFENKKIKRVIGLNLTVVVVFSTLMAGPLSASNTVPEAEITAIRSDEVKIITEDSVRYPLDSVRITQGYRFYHRAVDFGIPIGNPIYPVMDGVIEGVYNWRFSYGNHIIVNHGSGYKSLYGHLSKILVKEGQEVDKNTVIGLSGSTGFSTGPHLHLEVWENDHQINPLTFIK